MARIPYPDESTLSPKVREALDALPALNVFRMLAHAETAFRPFLRFGGAILGALELDPRLRELAILQVARSSGAEYEWVQHVPIARAVGVSDEQIAAVEDGAVGADGADGADGPDGALDERERLVVRVAAQVTRAGVTDEATTAALVASFPPREVVELLLTAGNYRMLAAIMRTLELDLDEPAGEAVLERARPDGPMA